MKSKNFFGLLLTACLIICASCQNDITEQTDEEKNSVEMKSKKRICLSAEHTKSLMLDPEYRDRRIEMLRSFEKFSKQRTLKANCTSAVIIPVAVHYQGVNNPNSGCLQSLAIDQINKLNLDYTGENSDISKWTGQASSYFSGVTNGEMCVQFVIADKNHPSGYGLQNGDLAITINRTQGDQVNNWAGYINIFVQRNTGYLGYAPLGGYGDGDGVVIDASAFGIGQGCENVAPEAPYNLGRTLTHEMGHYLFLEHIWGDGCGIDDEVADTPEQSSDYGGCPGLGASSCGSTDMHMNYMDYTDDNCMYMFTSGQEDRMTNFLLSNLGAVVANASNVYSGSTGGSGGGGGSGATCSVPAGLSISAIGSDAAHLSWNPVSGVVAYSIRYKVAGSTTYQNFSTNTTNTTLTGLQAATQYEVSVRTDCANTSSGYTSNLSFTTNVGGNNGGGGNICITPETVVVSNINSSSVLVDWEDITESIRYQIRYKVFGSTSWSKVTVGTSDIRLNSLLSETYEYQLRTRCPDGWTIWSDSKTFDLKATGGSVSNSLKVVVTLDDYGSETEWLLYDSNNNLLQSGGPYQDGTNGVKKSKTFTVSDGCYEIDLYDAFGDGICCEYGNGNLEVLNANNQRIAFSDGNFGTYELITFCISNGSARIIKQEKDNKKLARGKKKKL